MLEVLWPLLRTLFCVILVIVLAYLATKYLVGGRLGTLGAAKGAGTLKIQAQLPLGKDQRLIVVQAGERFLLLGATPTQISTLAEFDEEQAEIWREKAEAEESSISTPEGTNPSFREALRKVTKQRWQR